MGAWLLFGFVGVLIAVLRSVCDIKVYQNRSKRRLNNRVAAVVVEAGSEAWDNFGCDVGFYRDKRRYHQK